MRRIAAAVLLLATACSRGGDESEDAKPAELEPLFPPATAAPGAAPAGAADGGPDQPATSPTSASAPPSAAPTAPPPIPGATQGVISDAAGDATPSIPDAAPKWADLAGARLIRRIDGFELRVRLADAAPTKSPDGEHTMNIASFYDVDGDGSVNFEVWLNLGPNGWGGSWFDNDTEQARFQEEAQLQITVEGTEVVARFPVGHVGGAETFRWSLASEYGRYEAIGTLAMARDDAPDDDQPAAFPS